MGTEILIPVLVVFLVALSFVYLLTVIQKNKSIDALNAELKKVGDVDAYVTLKKIEAETYLKGKKAEGDLYVDGKQLEANKK